MSSLFPTYARWDIEPSKASGLKITSETGKEYLDFTSGIGVLNLGHCHELVKMAVTEQLNKYWHVSNMFQSSIQERTAKMLADASGLSQVFFANSGAEANEAAIKLARKATGKSKIVTCQQSFHGRTFATMAATGQEKIKTGFGPMLASFEYVPFNDHDAMKAAIDENTAAVMIEIVQGEGGIHVVQQSYLDAIQTKCKEHGALLIIDEIQTGIGRTGKPFAFQHFNILPDIITSAKGLGNGLPIGAMIGKEELSVFFDPGSHGSTFGGNPVSVSAAEAVLKEIFQSGFLKETVKKAEYLESELAKALNGIEEVKEIRGLGMMVGIECKQDVQVFLMELQKEGLLVLSAGPKVLRLLPSLTVSESEIDMAINKIKKVLAIKQTV
ncbi:acetylornithine transaminase [Peribacillus frigoritolerans]|jgi:acetylornithine aminotransferase|uniref:acetylornithine transaminase n=1 Tax=Peribacillus frigoritolerans TaxID=450367 RepID=UPI00227FD5AE|nr:acetylornithine transaminase [Peribacillus frigoritolerans]MCY9003796.1 acetylornithine transaminase [Peribacillus frigoritolerans]MED4632946.1 acetylornithine transaminase [Peribacillus frigoritolerans]